MPGPPPVRDDERRRRNKDVVETTKVDLAELTQLEVEIPAADERWHPLAKLWYDALARSGQAIFYEPSDWATAYLTAESISRDLKPQVVGISEDGEAVMALIPLKGSSLSAYMKVFASLMVTEGERRRVRVELERRKVEKLPEGVVPITQRRANRLTGS